MIDIDKVGFTTSPNIFSPKLLHLTGGIRVEISKETYKQHRDHAEAIMREDIWREIYGDLVPLVGELFYTVNSLSQQTLHSESGGRAVELCALLRDMLQCPKPKEKR